MVCIAYVQRPDKDSYDSKLFGGISPERAPHRQARRVSAKAHFRRDVGIPRPCLLRGLLFVRKMGRRIRPASIVVAACHFSARDIEPVRVAALAAAAGNSWKLTYFRSS